MSGPSITVNTYSDSLTGHTNVTFRDASGNHIGTWGANVDIGSSSMPGSLGGVFAENPNRTPSYTHQIILPDAAFNTALAHAREQARITANGGGDYSPLLVNCYDFVADVLWQAGIGNAFEYMQPGSLVRAYGEVVGFLLSSSFEGHFNLMVSNPDYQPVTNWQMTATIEFIGGQKIETEDEIIIVARAERVIYETWVSPIAFDLAGNGFQVVNLDTSRSSFNFFGDGQTMRSAWLSGDDGFLVTDTNGDGHINDITEMFGGRAVRDGFEKLRTFDTDGSGAIDAADADFDKLLVWRDFDGDGATDDGELSTLSDLAITFMSLNTLRPNERIGDAINTEASTAVIDGRTVQMADLHFRGGGRVVAEAEGADNASAPAVQTDDVSSAYVLDAISFPEHISYVQQPISWLAPFEVLL